jgi:riboflavin kinase/FMN adenylyltransferase
VAHGKRLGSRQGFPTVNLCIPDGLIVPAFGVYATRVWVLPVWPDNHEPPGPQHLPGEGPYMAVTNVGVRPTVEDGDQVTVESFLLDFNGDLYGRTVRVEFYKYLRPERKFPSVEALAEEIQHNADQTREFFGG